MGFSEQDDLVVSKIVLSCRVPAGTGRTRHENRASEGLVFYETGEGEYLFDDGVLLTVREGEILYLPKGASYRVLTEKRGDCTAINFLSTAPYLPAPQVMPLRDRRGFFALFREAEEAWRRKGKGDLFRCRAALYGILSKLEREKAQGYAGKAAQKILPGVVFLQEHYTEKATVEEAARLCRMTPEYFRRLFQKEYGLSPAAYRMRLRMERARELLETGLCSVTEAALSCGFSELPRFSRAFKAYHGVSPSGVQSPAKEKESS